MAIATDAEILEYPNRFQRGCANNPICHCYFLTVLEQELHHEEQNLYQECNPSQLFWKPVGPFLDKFPKLEDGKSPT